jgi:tetratricopeptide (TPR) repeat protein
MFDPQRGSTGAGSAAASARSYNNSSAGSGSNAGIQGNAVTPPSLSAPTSARGMLSQDSLSKSDGSYSGGGGSSSQRVQQLQQQKARQPSMEGSPTGREGSGAGPLEYGSPPLVSRSGSWTTLNNPQQQQQQHGSIAGSVASILSRPPSALSGLPPAAAGSGGSASSGSGSSSSVEADPAKRSKLADYYHARGYAARKQGNFKGAVEEYSRALALSPTHFKALFNRGFSYDKVQPAAC